MRWLWAVVAASGCLQSSAVPCSSGGESWVCPAGYACAEVGAYCGLKDEVAACVGQGAFGSCTTSSMGSETAGRCIFGVCNACAADTEADLEGCVYTGWKAMTSPTSMPLHGVWDIGRADAYVVGDDTLLHYNGNNWSTPAAAPALGGASLGGVWASGSDDVFVVVSGGDGGLGGDILHFDGTTWSVTAAGSSSERLGAVFGAASNDVYAVGDQIGSNLAFIAVVRQFDGSAWTTTRLGNGILSGVWASPDLAVAVGELLGSGVIWRSTGGGAWTQDSVQAPPLTGVWGSSDQDIFATGHVGATTTLLHWDGSGWTTLPACGNAPCIEPNVTLSLSAVSGRSADDIYAVGDTGGVLHFDGSQWTTDATSTAVTLDGVATGSDAEELAVGSGEILRKTAN